MFLLLLLLFAYLTLIQSIFGFCYVFLLHVSEMSLKIDLY